MLTVTSFTLHRMQRATWPSTVQHMFLNKLTGSTKLWLQNIRWESHLTLVISPLVLCLMTSESELNMWGSTWPSSTPWHMFSPIDKHTKTGPQLILCTLYMPKYFWFLCRTWIGCLDICLIISSLKERWDNFRPQNLAFFSFWGSENSF